MRPCLTPIIISIEEPKHATLILKLAGLEHLRYWNIGIYHCSKYEIIMAGKRASADKLGVSAKQDSDKCESEKSSCDSHDPGTDGISDRLDRGHMGAMKMKSSAELQETRRGCNDPYTGALDLNLQRRIGWMKQEDEPSYHRVLD